MLKKKLRAAKDFTTIMEKNEISIFNLRNEKASAQK